MEGLRYTSITNEDEIVDEDVYSIIMLIVGVYSYISSDFVMSAPLRPAVVIVYIISFMTYYYAVFVPGYGICIAVPLYHITMPMILVMLMGVMYACGVRICGGWLVLVLNCYHGMVTVLSLCRSIVTSLMV